MRIAHLVRTIEVEPLPHGTIDDRYRTGMILSNHARNKGGNGIMSSEKKQEKEQYKPYEPEEPVDEKTRRKEQQEIRDAAKHAAQETAAEELGDEEPISREQAEKEMRDAARKVQQEKKKK